MGARDLGWLVVAGIRRIRKYLRLVDLWKKLDSGEEWFFLSGQTGCPFDGLYLSALRLGTVLADRVPDGRDGGHSNLGSEKPYPVLWKSRFLHPEVERRSARGFGGHLHWPGSR